MWDKKKYNLSYCRDCDEEFLSAVVGRGKSTFCPLCGENIYTEFVMSLWSEPFQKGRPWTKDEDELILVGIKNGYSYQQIAESLEGRTPKAVIRRRQRIVKNENYKPWTTTEENLIRSGRARGLAYAAIYREHFVGYRTEQAVRSQGKRIEIKDGVSYDKRKTAI